jgi:hypothetical protein
MVGRRKGLPDGFAGAVRAPMLMIAYGKHAERSGGGDSISLTQLHHEKRMVMPVASA